MKHVEFQSVALSSMSSTRKWFTCTPVRFKGDHTFFARDSGLLCKGFQEIGVACKAIMPGPPMEDDQTADLIRTDYVNLEDPAWWRALGGDGVVFYGWGLGRYRKIAAAIRAANLILVCNMDTSGIFGVVSGFSLFQSMIWKIARQRYGANWRGVLAYLLRLGYGSLVAPIAVDIGRAMHLRNASVIGCVTPIAIGRIEKVCKLYGGVGLASRVALIPHPIAPYMRYDPSVTKSNSIVAIGRWHDRVQKDPSLLAQVIDRVCEAHSGVSFDIVGGMPEDVRTQFAGLNLKHGGRIRVHGVIPNVELKPILQSSRISLCTSLYESFHIASGESLCCGASVVGPDVPEIPSMQWFATEPWGRSATRSAQDLAEAVLSELGDWERGRRHPAAIAGHWSAILHAPQVAGHIIRLCQDSDN